MKMMPESSFQILNDETFPTSLLLEFDALDDDIPISPPRMFLPVNNTTASGSRSSVTTTQTNSSNETYSLLTENENGSGSSNSSNQFVKYNPAASKRIGLTQNSKISDGKSSTSSSSSGSQMRSKSEGNLLNSNVRQSQACISKSHKYGHVKSKVKQYIDETLSQHTYHTLVRHKSLPESTTESVLQEKTKVEAEQDANILRAMLKETSDEVSNLQRHLEFTELLRKDDIAKIEALKRKIETMRLEHSKREKERQRERHSEKELDRQLVLANYLRYSSKTSLNRVFASVSTQTSPGENISFNNMTLHNDESIVDILASHYTSNLNVSTAPRAKRVLLYTPDSEQEPEQSSRNMLSPDSATHPQGSPVYPQLRPAITVSNLSSEDSTGTTMGLLIQDNSVTQLCKKCTKKKKKGKNKKTRLASFFCIKNDD